MNARAFRTPVPEPPARCSEGHESLDYECPACEHLDHWQDAYQAWLESDGAARLADIAEAEAARCPICGDTGVISFTTQPYGRGFGLITEAIPCACRTKR